MCVTCGCSDGSETTLTHLGLEGTETLAPKPAPLIHSHVQPDGQIITHSHGLIHGAVPETISGTELEETAETHRHRSFPPSIPSAKLDQAGMAAVRTAAPVTCTAPPWKSTYWPKTIIWLPKTETGSRPTTFWRLTWSVPLGPVKPPY
ncbi:MAG: hypothetical protein HC922_08470 [Leptolyngbyaceae cyanobacterium SM2_3_12]|nr:hypothetical protein [Leptolyngbyaceae cyanobacterium SM2_3_12]